MKFVLAVASPITDNVDDTTESDLSPEWSLLQLGCRAFASICVVKPTAFWLCFDDVSLNWNATAES